MSTTNNASSVEQPKKRRSHPKTRTGCITCRFRKVKCDEAKPVCLRCVRTGRKCDGYAPSKARIFELPPKETDEATQVGDASERPNNPIGPHGSGYNSITELIEARRLPLPTISQRGWNSDDTRSFQWYQERGVPFLSSYLGRNFWTYVLPRMSHRQPAVKHSLIATAALLEKLDISRSPVLSTATEHNTNRLYTLHKSHLAKAIALTKVTREIPVVLMCCLLFVFSGFIKGDIPSSMSHVAAGRGIINEWRTTADCPTSVNDALEDIEPVFACYEARWRAFRSTSLLPELRKRVECERPNFEAPYIHWSFGTVYEALHSFDGIVQWSAVIFHHREYFTRQEIISRLQDRLDVWAAAFGIYKDRLSNADLSKNKAGIIFLQMHHRVARLATIAFEPDTELIFDSYTQDFATILQHLKTVISPELELETQALFTIPSGLGVIMPLFFIATRCRDIAIRHEALSILRTIDKTEGPLNNCAAHAVAEKVVSVEERCLDSSTNSTFIPEDGRIRAQTVRTCLEKNQVLLTYQRVDREIQEEALNRVPCRWQEDAYGQALGRMNRIIWYAGFEGKQPGNCSCNVQNGCI